MSKVKENVKITLMFKLSIKKETFLLILFLLIIGFFTLRTISDNDVFYHLKTGQYILETQSIPTSDIFSFTAYGNRWVSHEWLSALIFFLIYKVFGGILGIIIFSALVCISTYYLAIKMALRKGANLYFILALIFPIAFLTLELWIPRPQIFSYFFVVFLIFLLERVRSGSNKKILYFIPLIFLIWANLHASVVLGLGILLFYLIAEFIKILIVKFNFYGLSRYIQSSANKNWQWFLLGVFVLSFGLSFVNPNTYHSLIYLFTIAPVIKFLGVMEWKSLLAYLYLPQAIIFLFLMIASVTFIFWSAIKRKSIDLIELGLVTIFLILPLISIRHLSYFPLIVFPILITELTYYFKLNEFLEKTDRKFLAGQILLVIGIILLIVKLFTLPTELVNRHYLPVGATDFIKESNLQGQMFNLEMGGYLIYRLWPEQKVFLDGRNEVFAGQPAEEYKIVALTQDGWQEIIKKYDINYFIFWYRQPLVDVARNLSKQLRGLNYKLVYWDDASVIYVKNNEQNKEIIEKYEYKIAEPFYDPNKVTIEDFKQVGQEVLSALKINPDSNLLFEYAKILSSRANLINQSK